MKTFDYDRLIASIVVFVLTVGVIIFAGLILMLAINVGFFQVGVGILIFLLLAKFSWALAKVVIENGD